MYLQLIRTNTAPTHTTGRLYIEGQPFCDTLEDADRHIEEGGEKIYSQTAHIQSASFGYELFAFI